MTQVYELSVGLGDEDHCFYVEHRFPALPDRATILALRDEASATFEALFPDEQDPETTVHLTLVPMEERGTPQPVGDRVETS